MSDTEVTFRPGRSTWPLLALMTLIAAAPAWPCQAQEMPFGTLRDWSDYNNAGWIALRRGNLDRAATAFRAAVEVVRPYQATEPKLMARSNADFAKVLFLQKRYDEAEPLARWALMIREKNPGDRSEALTQNLMLLAQIQHARKQAKESEPLLRRTLQVQEHVLGGGHSDLVATLEELADVQTELGKLGDSAMNYQRALTIRDANHEANVQKSQELERRAMAIRDVTASFGAMGAMGRSGVSTVLQAEMFEKDAEVARESSAESVSAATATARHAAVLHRVGRHEEAESLEVRAKAMRDAAETRAARLRAGSP